jgi:hypothetical protein
MKSKIMYERDFVMSGDVAEGRTKPQSNFFIACVAHSTPEGEARKKGSNFSFMLT